MNAFRSPFTIFFSLWRPSLGRRLAVCFTLFGIVIGYAVLLYTAISSTNLFIHTTANLIRSHISALSEGATGDQLITLLNQKKIFQQ